MNSLRLSLREIHLPPSVEAFGFGLIRELFNKNSLYFNPAFSLCQGAGEDFDFFP